MYQRSAWGHVPPNTWTPPPNQPSWTPPPPGQKHPPPRHPSIAPPRTPSRAPSKGGLRPTVSWGGLVGVQDRGVAPPGPRPGHGLVATRTCTPAGGGLGGLPTGVTICLCDWRYRCSETRHNPSIWGLWPGARGSQHCPSHLHKCEDPTEPHTGRSTFLRHPQQAPRNMRGPPGFVS